jgi:hypothetical protein
LLLQLEQFYWLILVSYGLSLGYLVLHLKGLSTRLQAVVQLLGDIGVVTGFVYFTGGLYSPFSFLYLTVIMVAAILLRGGGLVFAGLSAIAYGILVDLMVFASSDAGQLSGSCRCPRHGSSTDRSTSSASCWWRCWSPTERIPAHRRHRLRRRPSALAVRGPDRPGRALGQRHPLAADLGQGPP